MTDNQHAILIGTLLGDGYLQTTGKNRARLRLEHSSKQEQYLSWKVEQCHELFMTPIHHLSRFHPTWKKTYYYVRIQSVADESLYQLYDQFYHDGKKRVPENIAVLLRHPLSLAVWYMDDGYYYVRDHIAYLYIPSYTPADRQLLIDGLKESYSLSPVLKCKKKGFVLMFPVKETKKLMEIIQPYVIPSMSYKLPLDPVSTDRTS